MQVNGLVGNRFRLLHKAGEGGMGAVFRAQDEQTGETVAVKFLHQASDDVVARFSRETEILSELSHEGIVGHVAHGLTDDGAPYLAMEWLEGETLGDRLERGVPFDAGEAVDLAMAIGGALGAAHAAGIVHRDVKPENVFLVGCSTVAVKVLDFGIAHIHSASRLTATGDAIGTPGYMAPEQIRGEAIDPRTDVYSLGCVLYECLVGEPPFVGDTPVAVLMKALLEEAPRPRELQEDLPVFLDVLVSNMLAKDPARRPPTGTAVVNALLAPLAETVDDSQLIRRQGAALSNSEQRIVSIILASVDQWQPLELAATLTPQRERELDEALRIIVEPFSGRLERLTHGTWSVYVSGAGSPTEEARRAARCALAMRETGGELPMVLATGRRELGEAVRVGEVIDRAAEALLDAPPRGVRIDDLTSNLLGAEFVVRREGDALTLTGEREVSIGVRTLLGKPTPLVGRGLEVRQIESALDWVVTEPTVGVVLVTGAAGVGKSRLRYELLRRLADRQANVEVLVCRGDSLAAGSAFSLIAGAVRRWGGINRGDPLETQRQKLVERLALLGFGADRPTLCEFLGELAGVPFADEDSVQLRAARTDRVLMGDQLRGACEQWLAALCAERPVLLVMEDCHWGDRPTLDLLDGVLHRLAERPLMLLALGRPEVHERFPGLWSDHAVTEVKLGGLPVRAARELVRFVLGDDVDDATVGLLVERAQGNTFFLEELIRAHGQGAVGTLPDSVLGMVEARLSEIEPEARRVLRAASVFGREFSVAGTAVLLGGEREREEVEAELARLSANEVVTVQPDPAGRGSVFRFRHALVREAAYGMLTERDRVLGHALAGAWLEEDGETDGLVLAEHYDRGGESERAGRWYRKAAEQALEGNDLEETLARADRSLACGTTAEDAAALNLLKATAYRWRGEFAAMSTCAGEAMDAAPRGSAMWCAAAAESVVAARAVGDQDRAVALAQELAKAPEPADQAALARALARVVQQLFLLGRLELGERLLVGAAKLGDQVGDRDPTVLAWLAIARAFGAIHLGDLGSHLGHCGAAVDHFEQAGDRRGACNARVHLAFSYMEAGGYREAEVALREALAAAEPLGLHHVVATAQHNLGMALARMGELDEAITVEMAAIDMMAGHGDPRLEGAARHYAAIISLLQGQVQRADEHVQEAVELLAESPPLRAHALATQARVRLAEGAIDAALELSRAAMGVLASLGSLEEGEASVRLAHIEALHAAKELDAEREATRVAVERLQQRADLIADPHWRRRFLEDVPDHARTVAWARSAGSGDRPDG